MPCHCSIYSHWLLKVQVALKLAFSLITISGSSVRRSIPLLKTGNPRPFLRAFSVQPTRPLVGMGCLILHRAASNRLLVLAVLHLAATRMDMRLAHHSPPIR